MEKEKENVYKAVKNMKLKLKAPLKNKKKGEDTEGKSKKKLSKKNLLMMIIVLLLAAVAAKFTVFKDGIPSLPFGKGGSSQAEARLPDPVDFYMLLDDSVASITSAFEDAGEEVLLSMSTNYAPTEEGEEGSQGKAEKKDVEESEIMETNLPKGDYGYYYYRISSDTEMDISKYREFLLKDGFQLLESKKDTKSYVTKYQKEGVTPKKLFNLEIEYPLGGDVMTGIYAIRVSLEDKPEPQEKEGVSREQTLQYFNTLSQEKLGLPKPVSEYYVVMDMGRTFVDGYDCHGISLYEKGNGAGNYFIKKFYLSLEDKKLFEYMGGSIYTMEYNPSTGETTTSVRDDFNLQSVNNGGSVYDWNIGPMDTSAE